MKFIVNCNKTRVVSCNMIHRMEEKIQKKKSSEETSGTGSKRAKNDENKAKKTEDEKQERT